jgi:putative GTP pyrophosphokinase
MSAVTQAYEQRYPILKALAERLEKEVAGLLEGAEHVDRIYFRAKEPSHFVVKASKNGGTAYKNPLSEIEDQVAGRVLVFFLDDLDAVTGRLQANFATVESQRKAPAQPDAFGYESFHRVFAIPPHVKPSGWEKLEDAPVTFEMQVRTLFQHAWAEPQHDLEYKGTEETPLDARRELAWAASSAWGADHAFQRALRLIRGGKAASRGTPWIRAARSSRSRRCVPRSPGWSQTVLDSPAGGRSSH